MYSRKLACVARRAVSAGTPVLCAAAEGISTAQEKNGNKNASAKAGRMDGHFMSDSV
jgi:hypothetical protein